MRLNKGMFFLTATIMLLCLGTISAQQTENKNSADEAAAKKAAELAKLERITVDELKSKIDHNDPVLILDVRMPDDYGTAVKKIKGSVRISPYDLVSRMNEIPKDKDLVTYCTCPDDHTSARVAQILLQNGFTRVRVLKGGWASWIEAGGPIEPKDEK